MITTEYTDDAQAYKREREQQREQQRIEMAEYWRDHPEELHARHVAAQRARMLAAANALHLLGDRLRSNGAGNYGEWLDVLRPSVFTSIASQRAQYEMAQEIISAARSAASLVGLKITRRSTLKEIFEAARTAMRGMQ